MSDLPPGLLPEGFDPPPDWTLVTLRGGTHDGTRFWVQRPPRRFRVVAEGSEYLRAAEGVYAAVGEESDLGQEPGGGQASLL